MKVGQNSIFSLMVGVINFFSITLQKKGTDTVHKTFMNTLIYTVLKKKQHLWLLYSFFVCRQNLSGLHVPSEKQLKHKIHHSIVFHIFPFANTHLVRPQQLRRITVPQNHLGKAWRQDLNCKKTDFLNTDGSKIVTCSVAAVPKEILCD